jgi:hypothetical protein
MARIEEKRKEKLSSVIWTWVVVGVLSAVVLTGIVLGIIYLVDQSNKDDDNKEFEEQYPNAELITFEELDNLLDNATQSDIEVTDTIYVFVYSPDYETYSKGEELEETVNKVVAAETGIFYVINVESEDNSGYSIESSEFLSQEGLPSNYPYLLVVKHGANGIEIDEDGIVTNVREIKSYLNAISE